MGVVQQRLLLLLTMLILLLLASCGGTQDSALPELADGDAASVEAVSSDLSAADSSSELPGIPLEEATDRAASSAGPLTSVLGKDFIAKFNSSPDGDALLIGGPDARLAFGMYKFSGLPGRRPLSLNVECAPQDPGSDYYVGVADYTTGKWHWSAPINIPEYQFDLSSVGHQFVSHLGNMYFIVVTHDGASAKHFKSSLVHGDPLPGDRPGCPHHLIATDGKLPQAVRLEWLGGNGAAGFEVWRRPLFGEGQWRMIGRSSESSYLDAPLADWRMFLYRVRAVNPGGESCWSNVDSGFAGDGREAGIIRGCITTPGGQPVPNVAVRLLGADEQALRFTNAEGFYAFRDLAPGHYTVVPRSPELDFIPPCQRANLLAAQFAELNFKAIREERLNRTGGFVFTLAPPAPPQDGAGDPAPGEARPLVGVRVLLRSAADPGRVIEVRTNEQGFYLFEDIPEGIWLLSPQQPGWGFVPGPQQIRVNGLNRPDRHDFIGRPLPDDGGEGGGDGGEAEPQD